MRSDLEAMFANLAEMEKLKGHHSPEGRAIRTLSRAMSGWFAGQLSSVDVLVLCDQAIEDWLKARLKTPPWSGRSVPALAAKAMEEKLLTRLEAVRLERIHNSRRRIQERAERLSSHQVEAAIAFCLHLLERHW